MEQNNTNYPQTTFCRSGCGFYGSDSFEGLCSKCHKDQLTRQPKSSLPVTPAGRSSPSASSGTTAGEIDLDAVSQSMAKANIGPVQESAGLMSRSLSSVLATSASQTRIFETATPTIQTVPNVDKDSKGATGGAEVNCDLPDIGKCNRKRNRCFICRKKLGLMGFECRCSGQYCSLHRYSDKHNCTFNYKEMAQEQIRKNNPVIVGEKIHKI